MVEHIHTFTHIVTDDRGVRYRVRAEGEAHPPGGWDGWLIFTPERGAGAILRTGRETTQPEREDLIYWATGLEPVYLDGALARATRHTPP